MCFFSIVGMAGLYARQSEKSGWLGLADFVLFSLWFAFILGFSFVEVFILPLWATETPTLAEGFLGIFTSTAVHANEPGTLLYVLTKHPTEPHTYLWVERYRDQAAEQAHGEAPYFGEAMSRIQDPKWWAKPGEVLLLTQVVPQ
jgi:quinol monooxygenase YgiN